MNPERPSSSRAGPTRPGTATDNYYTPTLEEKKVVEAANKTFVASYLTGIFVGLAGGAMLVRHRGVAWKSMPGLGLLGATGLTGELIGRKTGEARARELLATTLPANSNLRKLLEQSNALPSTGTPAPITQGHDYSLEGSIMSPDMSPVATSASVDPRRQRRDDVPPPMVSEPAEGTGDAQSSWDSIRQNNPASNSSWNRIRTGRQPAVPSANGENASDDRSVAYGEGRSDTITIPRTRDEQLEQERQGHIRRGRYGDLDTPAVAAVGGRGLMGPYGDTVAATPAGSASIPRTREEMEEAFGRAGANIKRNKWGDLVD
ncbi:hypothetical protein HDU87_001313 [Geranomyces variabilis]|uniref:Uncharacterized protein n=1 Tax=Geranomyces variabilis TaxID=109894 RepID=A0AAD5TSH8_9FUNG|nr:hypothetical protein HDU87_001313 [Geranomyces variabilis]